MLKSNCICIILVIVAICIIAAIFIFCFCPKKNNYSRLGGGRIRGGGKPDFDKLRILIHDITDSNIDYVEIENVINKINDIETLLVDPYLINEYINGINALIINSMDLPLENRREAQKLLNDIKTWFTNTGFYKRIKQLESENESLKDRISDLEKAPSGSKIADLESENSRLRNRINELENEGYEWYVNTDNPYYVPK